MRKSIINSILYLTVISFIIKIMGFVFRIYLSNVIGAEGMGLYQLILSIYALGATISTVGISTALSRLVAINEKYGRRILKTGIIITEALSVFAMLLIFIKSKDISIYFLKDERCITSIKIISLSFPAISLYACLNGYFNGISKMKFPMTGQLIEQIVRIAFVIIFVKDAMGEGLESALLKTAMGIFLGEYISVFYLYFKYRMNLKYEKNSYTKKTFFKDILKINVPVSLSGVFQTVISTLESAFIPNLFVTYGLMRNEAISILGVTKGMAMPLIFFPTFILSSVSTVSLPSISRAQSKENTIQIKSTTEKTLRLSLIISFYVTVIYIKYGEYICNIMYHESSVSSTLKLMSIIIPFMYLNIGMSGILNGLGKQVGVMICGISDGIIRIVIMYFLIPTYGLYGYIITLLICEIILTLSCFLLLHSGGNIKLSMKKWISGPLVATICGLLASIKLQGNLTGIFVFTMVYFAIIFINNIKFLKKM